MEVSYDDVLVPTDGSGNADRATEHALGIAERYDATVHALYVLDDRYLTGDVEGLSEVATVERALEEEGDEAVETVVDRARERGISVTREVRRGVPARAIVSYCEDEGVDLVAMGTHGRTGLSRLLLGSVAERVVRTASAPVLTARGDAPDGDVPDGDVPDGDTVDGERTAELGGRERGPDFASTEYGSVLVPTDGSDAARRAAEHAVDLAAQYGATVHVLSVVDTRLPEASPLLASFEHGAEEAVEAIAALAEERDVEVTTAILDGTPAAAIVGYAEDEGIDLVTLGTHGRTGLDRVAIGSVAERVVRSAAMPVLTVRDGEES